MPLCMYIMYGCKQRWAMNNKSEQKMKNKSEQKI